VVHWIKPIDLTAATSLITEYVHNNTNIYLMKSFSIGLTLLAMASSGCFSPKSTQTSTEHISDAAVLFTHTPLKGLGAEPGVTRRDPSDVVQWKGQYYVWYTKTDQGRSGYNATIWYATSPDGYEWEEKGEALKRGSKDAWDSFSVFTPNILRANNRYYLFYTGVHPTPGNTNGLFENNNTNDLTAIGVAVADSPDGPFKRIDTNPILVTSTDPDAFDSYRVDDASLVRREGHYWLYYKGRSLAHGADGPRNTRMGVAIADQPGGPYRKHEQNPLTDSGHEVMVWPHGKGVRTLLSGNGPQGRTLQFAVDGLDFKKQGKLGPDYPKAPGLYRWDDFRDTKLMSDRDWGISMNHGNGFFRPHLVRFDMRIYSGSKTLPPIQKRQALAQKILSNPTYPAVLERGKALLETGLNAGSGYGEVWIRDLNTFIEIALQTGAKKKIRAGLLTFFKFQETDGNVPDGFIPKKKASVGYKYRQSELAPQYVAHKNTVETDQETSLVQAIRKYVETTGDRSILEEQIAGHSVLERLGMALDYVFTHRFDANYGLVWGATTVDWGDAQPEHDWGVELDEHSHLTLDIYDNAMMLVAIRDLIYLAGPQHPDRQKWLEIDHQLRLNVRKHLWDANALKFIPHIYLDGSPFPDHFNENEIDYHGGTAIAIEADLLTREEVGAALAMMRQNVKEAGAGSIGLTVYPPYPEGYFKNPGMVPYGYQNGGDWCWFGGRMIQQLIRYGYIEEAYTELKPMLDRVEEANGFHEWWSLKNEPRGSGKFRGSAGVLGKAILMLQTWAETNRSKALLTNEPKKGANNSP